jgi:YbbR-like protein
MMRGLGLLTRNIGWKLGALGLAILLWMATVGQPELVTTHAVPILYKDLPADLLVGADSVDTVRVELRGPATKLTMGSLADLAITLNLANVDTPGQRTFTLSGADLHLPPGVTFLRAIPSQLRIGFPRRAFKEVPVDVQIGSQPPAGYRVVSQEVTPPTVRIAGPERRVNAVLGAQTDAIDLGAATSPTEIRVNAFVNDAQVWMDSSPVVIVRLKIEKDSQNK